MKLYSPSFQSGDYIPSIHSRDGGNFSPSLHIDEVPAPAKSLVLIMDDPDAPRGTFTHWVLFDIYPQISQLGGGPIPVGAREGTNDWDQLGYGGPRPPHGEHRYFFKAYALDCELGLPAGASRTQVDQAMRGHVIGSAELMGRYAASEKAVGVPEFRR